MAGVGDVDGDGIADFLVGSRYQDVNGNADQGRVYLFSGATAQAIRTIENPVPQAGASFGRWTNSAGDVDRDGVPDLFIGAPFQQVDGFFQSGLAHVFSGADGHLIYTFRDPTPETKGHFGLTVAGIRDVTSDGVPDLFVGAHFKDIDGHVDQGRAFIFSGADGSLARTLNNPISMPYAFFGFPVMNTGDVDGDGVFDLLLGAARHTADGNRGQGRVYVFSGATAAMIRALDDPDPQANAYFGRSVASLGDVNGDGVPDVAVGAHDQQVNGIEHVGRVYVYSGANGAWIRTIDSPHTSQAWFGFPVGSIADVNGDAVPDILVGAPFQTSHDNAREGRAYIFSGRDGVVLHTLLNPSPQTKARFGFRIVEVGGDTNGDGIPELLVGAFKQDVTEDLADSDAHGGHGAGCPLDDVFPGDRRAGIDADEGQAFLYVSHRY
jgi:hypothetical protein